MWFLEVPNGGCPRARGTLVRGQGGGKGWGTQGWGKPPLLLSFKGVASALARQEAVLQELGEGVEQGVLRGWVPGACPVRGPLRGWQFPAQGWWSPLCGQSGVCHAQLLEALAQGSFIGVKGGQACVPGLLQGCKAVCKPKEFILQLLVSQVEPFYQGQRGMEWHADHLLKVFCNMCACFQEIREGVVQRVRLGGLGM